MAADPAIRAAGLSHRFGEGDRARPTLINIDLAIIPGEVVILDGPSGSGKTTLLTLIGGLRRVQEGALEVLGRELKGMTDRELVAVRLEIGFIFQAHNLFSSLSAFENIRLAMELHGGSAKDARSRAADLLGRFLMGEHIDKKPAKLSGGQKQRVAIARALSYQPRLILADEPTAALDATSGRIVMDEFLRCAREERATVLIVTHDDRIKRRGDRVVTLEDGRIKYDFYPKEAALIAKFLAASPLFRQYQSNPVVLIELASKMTRELHPAGSVLFRQGEPGEKFYLIRSGKAVVEIRNEETGEVRQVHLGESDAFGEIALMEKRARTGTVRVLEDLTAYSLSAPDFSAAISQIGPFEEQIMALVRQRQ